MSKSAIVTGAAGVLLAAGVGAAGLWSWVLGPTLVANDSEAVQLVIDFVALAS